jgi:PD-(D/E)XK nuclease superfamily protein
LRLVVHFNACSSYAHHPHPKIAKRDYGGEVDYFGVYCRETAGVYLGPIEDLPVTRSAALRVAPAKNAQRRRIRPAEPYLVVRSI